MPLFSLSRRKRRPTVSHTESTASLPNLATDEPGLGPWPEALVDASSLRHTGEAQGESEQTTPTKAGATKSAFAVQGGTISFHRPFRGPPPSAFPNSGGPGVNGSASVPAGLTLDSKRSNIDIGTFDHPPPPTPTHKRPRAPVQTFNLLVAGARGSGKTSMLNLLLSTSPLPRGVKESDRPRLAQEPTAQIVERKLEVEQGMKRYMLMVIDTPGLVMDPGRELEFDRGLQSLVRYQEKLMGEALVMESKVVREFAADQLVHICLYLIDPSTVLPRPAPTPVSKDANAPVSQPPASPALALRVHPSDLTAIRRLSQRYHVLPIISKADTLTDRQLRRVKAAVRRDMEGLSGASAWGVFAFAEGGAVQETEKAKAEQSAHTNGNGDSTSHVQNGNGNGVPAGDDLSASDGESTPKPTKVIHIRPTASNALSPPKTPQRLRRSRSLSRARPSADSSDSDTPTSSTRPEEKVELGGLLPWAVVAPEEEDEESAAEEAGQGKAGKWVRKYRWGEVDVMSKEHCDFWAVRRAVLGVYFKVLKNDTRRVLYEKYRTDKLLARRATRALSEDERKKLYSL